MEDRGIWVSELYDDYTSRASYYVSGNLVCFVLSKYISPNPSTIPDKIKKEVLKLQDDLNNKPF